MAGLRLPPAAEGPAPSIASARTAPKAEPAKDTGAERDWNAVLYPILAWAPIFGADAILPEQPGPPPCDGCPSPGPIIPEGSTSGSLNGAAFVAFRVEKSKFALYTDFNYAGLSGSRDVPFAHITVKFFVWGLAGGYEVARDLYVEGGVRLISLNLGASILEFPEVKWNPDIWQPVVGATFHPQLTKRWRLYAHADAGGLGITSNWTAVGTGRFEWQPARHFELTLGYGFLYFSGGGDILSKPVHLTQTLHGPIIGIGIPF